MDDELIRRVLDLNSIVRPKERTEKVRTGVTFGGDRGYIAAERVVRV